MHFVEQDKISPIAKIYIIRLLIDNVPGSEFYRVHFRGGILLRISAILILSLLQATQDRSFITGNLTSQNGH